MPLAVLFEDHLGVPGMSGIACTTPAKCVAAFGQNATSEPWKSWMVCDRPTAFVPAVPTA